MPRNRWNDADVCTASLLFTSRWRLAGPLLVACCRQPDSQRLDGQTLDKLWANFSSNFIKLMRCSVTFRGSAYWQAQQVLMVELVPFKLYTVLLVQVYADNNIEGCRLSSFNADASSADAFQSHRTYKGETSTSPAIHWTRSPNLYRSMFAGRM